MHNLSANGKQQWSCGIEKKKKNKKNYKLELSFCDFVYTFIPALRNVCKGRGFRLW